MRSFSRSLARLVSACWHSPASRAPHRLMRAIVIRISIPSTATGITTADIEITTAAIAIGITTAATTTAIATVASSSNGSY